MLYTLFIQSITNSNSQSVQYFEYEATSANDAIVNGFDEFMQSKGLDSKTHKVIGLGQNGQLLFWMYPLSFFGDRNG